MADALQMAWHGTRLQPLAEVAISPLDRGFLFGDGVYEVIPVYAGQPLRLDLHLGRFARSLAAIRLPAPMSDAALSDVISTLIAANGGGDQSVYLQASRNGDTGRDHRFPAQQYSTLFAMCSRLRPVTAADYADGVVAVTLADQRWARCDIKSTSLLANVLARQAASEAGAAEAILTRDGRMIEGAASAAVCIIDGVCIAPPEDNAVLPSITRRIVLELAHSEGVTVEVRDIRIDECRTANELLLMSSTKELMPVVTLDGMPIGNGQPGPVWSRLFSAYQRAKLVA